MIRDQANRNFCILDVYYKSLNMDSISITGLIASIASLGLDLFDRFKRPDLLPKIANAYNKALKRWCKNDDIRNRIASKFLDYTELVHYIQQQSRSELPIGYVSFLQVWETELRNDLQTYSFLEEILIHHGITLAHEIIADQHNIKEQINRKTEELKEEIHKLAKPNIYESRRYEQPADYIQRSVRDYTTTDFFKQWANPNIYQPRPLVDYVLQYQKVVLYSEAQEGKSTELQQLAYEVQNSDLFQVVYYALKNHMGEPLLNELPFDYLRKDSSKRGILIFDGLDEIKDATRSMAIRQIEQIAELYPDLYLVVSCRSNFESTNSVNGFKKLYLNSLTYYDVECYLRKHCTQPDMLLSLIKEKDLYELIYNPFYLKSILDYFEKDGVLPDTKCVIYDYVIKNSFTVDQQRNKGGIIAVEEEALLLLEKIAFCLQFTEQPFFNYQQLRTDLSLSDSDIEKSCSYTIFKKDADNHYSFTHNAFREYLAARKLTKTTFDKLRSIICYPETEILRPSLYNTVLLLIGLLERNEPLLSLLMEWLANNNPEVLFLCEKHFLSDQRCTEIFKMYFEHLASTEQLVEYTLRKKAMFFANNRDAILFLFETIRQSSYNYDVKLLNALSFLRYADITLLNTSEQKYFIDCTLVLLENNKDDRDHTSLLFELFRNSYFQAEKHLSGIYDIINDSTNPILLNQFFSIIKDAGLADKYIDWIIDRRKYICNFGTKGTIYIVDKDPLINGLVSVETIEHVVLVLLILNDCIGSYMDKERVVKIYTSLFNKIQDRISDFTEGDLTRMTGHLISDQLSADHHKLGIVHAYREFFRKNNYDTILFTQYYKELKNEIKTPELASDNHIWAHLNIISIVMSDEYFDRIEQDLDLTEDQKYAIINRLDRYSIITENETWRQRIEAMHERHSPWRANLKKSAQDGFDILFDFKRFEKEIKTFAETHEILTHHWSCHVSLKREGINESVIAFIDDYEIWNKTSKIHSREVVNALQNHQLFIRFKLNRLEHYKRQQVTITEDQQQHLCGFINDCIDHGYHSNELMDIICSYKIKLDDNRLVSLLPYSIHTINNDYRGFHNSCDGLFLQYISDRISDRRILETRIEEIIQNDIHFSVGLYCKLTLYIIENRISRLYQYFESILFHPTGEQYGQGHQYRSSIIETVLLLGNDGMRRLEAFKERFDDHLKLDYYVYILRDETLAFDKDSMGRDLLLMYKTATEDTKGDILGLLLRIGNIEALDLFVTYYKQNNLNLHYYKPSFEQYGFEQVYQIKQIFELSHMTGEDIIASIRRSTLSRLNDWALSSQEQNDFVAAYYRKLIDMDFEKYHYLCFYIFQNRKKYYELQPPTMRISEAISLYNSIIA